MAQRTKLVMALRSLEAEIEASRERDGGGDSRALRLYRELWDALAAGAPFDAVAACSAEAAKLARWIERHLEGDRSHAIGKALLEHREFGASAATVCHAWGVRPSEWAYLRELARYVGERIRGGAGRRWPTEWVTEVEAYHERVSVVVSDQALEDMLLGAWEAYFVPVPDKPRSRRSEVYGVCFGSIKEERHEHKGEGRQRYLSIHVRRVALQLRARAGRNYVVPNLRSEEEHVRMARELFPHLDLVGDFHSHPYATLADLQEARGWDYTAADEEDNQAWYERMRACGHQPRVGLILALAQGERSGRAARSRKANLIRTTFGRCQGYLAAYRMGRDGSYHADGVTLQRPAISRIGT